MEIEKGSTKSHCLQKTLWKRLGTYRKTDYAKWVMMKLFNSLIQHAHFSN